MECFAIQCCYVLDYGICEGVEAQILHQNKNTKIVLVSTRLLVKKIDFKSLIEQKHETYIGKLGAPF